MNLMDSIVLTTLFLLDLRVQNFRSWEQFREKYIENGGDGFYAASKLLFQEPIFKEKNIGFGDTPTAAKLQKSLMNFITNQ